MRLVRSVCLFVFLFSLLPITGASAEISNFILSENADYVLGAGDLVRISVYGSPDMQTEARISANGTISFPLLGTVKLSGLSARAAEKTIGDMLVKGGFIKNANVNLVVAQYQSYSVSVLGDVYKPGKYSLDKPSRLSELLAMAGGSNPNGSDIISVIRTESDKTTKSNFDLRKIIANADSLNNPIIKPDDIVYVNAREVSVLGQVNRPGKYSVTNGVRTILDFLSQAGGIAPAGSEKIIVMTNQNGRLLKHEVDVDLLFRGGEQSINFELANGDSIYVPRASVFYIYGEVQRPGSFRLERNMSVAQALSLGGGLTPKGTERSLAIKRNVNGKLVKLDAKAGDMLQSDDIVYVGESLF
jgi:polysaccharide biosynthesis/export protein